MQDEHDNDKLSISGPSGVGPADDVTSAPEIEGYNVLGCLGHGGMGSVWRAVQLSTGREVALKLLPIVKSGSEKSRARFEREVELTARLRHPNIAQVYDSGLDHGIYYYAMEFVDGVPLDKYVEEEGLTPREILELMRTVCEGVQHAHERAVIHRDLKPSNILVTADGQPHLVDFGLAKAFLEGDSELSLSADGAPTGTPAFMSPEQAAGDLEQIDTRTDVYSLGVILFRLVTGKSPHDLSGSVYDVLRRTAADDVRRPREVCKDVDRELEALLLKALAHDPKGRYSSAGALAQDIENYLTGEPLLARQRSTLYFLRKRLWKYRVPVTIGCSIAAVLIGVAAFAYIRIAHERNKAVAAHDKAQDEADKANTVYEFLGDILSSVEPEKAHGREVTLREAVDQAAKDAATKFANQPEVEARIRTRIGDIYSALGQYRDAEGQYVRALEIRRDQLGGEHPDTLASMFDLAKSLGKAGKLRESETMHRELLEIRRRVLGNEHVDTLKSLGALGITLLSTGKLDESERVLTKAVQLDESVFGEEHKVTLEAMAGLASTLTERGRLDEAEAMARHVLGIRRRVLGEQHPETMDSVRILARVLSFRGEGDEAGAIFERDLAFQRETLGDEHPGTLGAMTNWTWVLWNRGKLEEAEATARKVFEARRELLGDEHPDTLTAMYNLARAIKRRGELREPETILKRCIEFQQRVLGEEHPKTLRSMRHLAEILSQEGEWGEAAAMQGRVLEACERVLGEEHWLTLDVMNSWGAMIGNGKRWLDAMCGDVLRGRPPETIRAMYNMEDAIWEGDIVERVEALYRRCLDIRQRTLGPEHHKTLQSMSNLAIALMDGGELGEAEALVRQHLEIELRAFDEKVGDKEPPPVTSPIEAEPTEGEVLAYDDFDGKLALDWNVQNPDPSHHSLTKTPGMLTITTQKGDLWNAFTDYKNLFLIDCPASEGEDFQLTTCLSSFTPVGSWNQAGLILYNHDDEYLKFVYEAQSVPVLTVGFERGGPRFDQFYFSAHANLDKLWLRVTKQGNRYTFSTSLDGKRFTEERWPMDLRRDLSRGFGWGDGSVKQVGLLAMNGVDSEAPGIDASFDFFEVRSIPARTDAAEEEIRAAAHKRGKLGSTLWVMSDVGGMLGDKGELERAESILKECLETQRRVFGTENRHTVRSLNRLSSVLDKQDRLDEMEQVTREVVEIRRRVQGEHHPDTLTAMDNLASLLIRQGKHAEAEQVHREALEVCRRSLGEDHPETLLAIRRIATALCEQGKFGEAEALVRQCVETRLRAFDEKFGDKEPPPVTSPIEVQGSDGKVLAYDDFDGKLALDWHVQNPDPSHHSLTKTPGMLTITTQEGAFARSSTNYKNLFVIDCPAGANAAFQLTTCLSSFNPVERWHQAGLVLYNHDDAYLKFVYEWGPRLTLGFERGSPSFGRTYFSAHSNLERLWLRVTKRGNRYTFSTSLDGKRFIEEKWSMGLSEDLSGGFEWGDGAVKQVGLLAMNGVDSQATEIDASFDFFEVRSVPGKADAPEEEILAAGAERDKLGSTLWVMSDVGNALREKGELERAESVLKECLETQRRVFGTENRHTVRSLHRLSWVLYQRDKLDETEKLVREVVEIRRRVQGEYHADTLTAMDNLASVLIRQGKHAEAEQVHREALEICRRSLGEDHPRTLAAMQNIATLLSEQGKFGEAEALVRQCVEARLRAFEQKFGDKEPAPVTSPWEAESADGKVLAYDDFDGKLALDWNIRNPDPSHHSLTKTPGMLTITTQKGDLSNAFTDYRNLFVTDCPASEGDDFQLTTCLSSFNPEEEWHQAGLILYNDDDEYLKFVYEDGPILIVGFERGDPSFQWSSFRAHPGLDRLWLRVTKRGNRYTFSTSLDGKRFVEERWSIGLSRDLSRGFEWGDGSVKQVGLLAINGADSEAPEIDASFDFFEVRSVPAKTDAPEEETLAAAPERDKLGWTLWTLSDLVIPLIDKGELEKAESILKECLETQRRVLGKENQHTVRSLLRLSSVLDKQDRLDEMEKVEREILEIRRRVQGEHHADTLLFTDELARTLIREGKHAEAEQVYREVLQVRRRVLGEDHPETATAMGNVATALSEQGKSDEAVSLAKKAVDLAPGNAAILDTLGWAYLRNGQFNEALQTFSDLFSLDAHHHSGWKGVSEVAQSSVEPEVFLRFCDDVAQIATKERAVEIKFHAALALFYEHREEKEKAQELWAKTGFVREPGWLVIGPFDNAGGSGFSKVYPPEEEIDVHATYPGQIAWMPARDDVLDGFIDFREMFDKDQWKVAYALTRVISPTKRNVQLRLGSDDDIKAWLNGEVVLTRNVARGAAIDQDVAQVTLKSGVNNILVKVCNRTIGWGFYLRITDMQGWPCDHDLRHPPAPGFQAMDQDQVGLAVVLSRRDKEDEADAMFEEDKETRVLNAASLSEMRSSALRLRQMGNFDEAEATFRRLLQTRLRVQGGEDPDTLIAMKDVATTLFMAGKPDEAEATLRQAVTTSRAQARERRVTPELMMYLARLLEAKAKQEEAELLRKESMEIQRRLRGQEAGDEETSPGAAEAQGKSVIPTNFLKIPEEMEACAENLQKIYAAIKQYEKDKGNLPAWLSDLVPAYLSNDALLCPKDSAQTSPSYPDPEIACSYTYEFSPAVVPGGWDPTGRTQCSHWKQAQVKLFGDVVPVVRCHHHGGMRLNVSLGGEIYWSSQAWEYLFVPNYAFGDELLVQPAAEQGEGIATSGDQ